MPARTETWENLTLADNFIFCKVMETSLDLCKHLLEMLLHIEIDRLEAPQTERAMQASISSKTVRFDVYTKSESRIFDLEMQTVRKTDIPRRTRYYQSMIDVDNINRGVDYKQLKDTYIIFLCLDDLFGKGLPVYSFENICDEDKSTKLQDGAYKVFFNAKECDKLRSDEERNFFKFLRGGNADDDFTRQLDEKISKIKRNSKWREQYMTIKQAFYDEIEEAAQLAAQANAIKNAQNLLRMNILEHEQISQAIGLPIEKIDELSRELGLQVEAAK